MRRFMAALCVLALIIFNIPALSEEAEDPSTLRALLIGCDFFITQEDTWPSASGSVKLMEEALSRDARGYECVRTIKSTVGSLKGLRRAILRAFAGADGNDISLLYICTHGVMDEAGEGILLSDGENEDRITPKELYDALSGVQGRTVVLLDACHSGAFIGKGLNRVSAANPFARGDYAVLASAGGAEPSYTWQSAEKRPSVLKGGSFFASTFARGVGGGLPADQDADGTVTLREMYGYLSEQYAGATPQLYPENDDTPLFVEGGSSARQKNVAEMIFDDTALTAGDSVRFSFTVTRRTRVLYEIVYYRDGAWRFDEAQLIEDAEMQEGYVSPGRKQRELSVIPPGGEEAYGYVCILLLSVREDTSYIEGSQLICVQPPGGDPGLSVETPVSYAPGGGNEMNIIVRHSLPCSLTVEIRDALTNTLKRRVCQRLPSCPQALSPEGSVLSWNGKNARGEILPSGEYYARVTVYVGGESYTADGEVFRIL